MTKALETIGKSILGLFLFVLVHVLWTKKKYNFFQNATYPDNFVTLNLSEIMAEQ
jgi:hypothetical protein